MATVNPPHGGAGDHDCGACNLPNDADPQMVQCDACQVWYHLKCVGETPGVENRSFNCRACQPPSNVGKSKPKKTRSQKGVSEGQLKVPVASTSGVTPIKHPEVPKCVTNKATTIKTTSSTSRSRALTLQRRIEAEQLLAEMKLAEAEKQLEEDRLMQERQRALREEKIRLQEDLLRKMQELDEVADAERASEYTSTSGMRKAREWLAKQRQENQQQDDNGSHRSIPPFLPSKKSERSSQKSVGREGFNAQGGSDPDTSDDPEGPSEEPNPPNMDRRMSLERSPAMQITGEMPVKNTLQHRKLPGTS
nr:transcription factor BYE1-like [Aedes albopictus]